MIAFNKYISNKIMKYYQIQISRYISYTMYSKYWLKHFTRNVSKLHTKLRKKTLKENTYEAVIFFIRVMEWLIYKWPVAFKNFFILLG